METMIVVGVLAITTLISAGMISSILDVQNKIDSEKTILDLFHQVQLAITTKNVCETALHDSAVPVSDVTNPNRKPKVTRNARNELTITLTDFVSNNNSFVGKGKSIATDLRVPTNGIEVKLTDTASVSSNKKLIYPMEVTITIEKKKNSVWSKHITKTFNTFAVVDETTSLVDTCYNPDYRMETAIAIRRGFAIEYMGCEVTNGDAPEWRNKNLYTGVGYKLFNGAKKCRPSDPDDPTSKPECVTNCAVDPVTNNQRSASYYDNTLRRLITETPTDRDAVISMDEDYEDDGVCFSPGKYEYYHRDPLNNNEPAGWYWGNKVVNNNPYMKSTLWKYYFPVRNTGRYFSPTGVDLVPPATVSNEGRCWVAVIKRPSGMTAADDNDIFVVPNVAPYFGGMRFLDLGCNARKGWVLLSCEHSTSGTGDHDVSIGVDLNGNQYCSTNDIVQPHGDTPFENGFQNITAVCGRASE